MTTTAMNEAAVAKALIGRRGGMVLKDLRAKGARVAQGRRPPKTPAIVAGVLEPTLQVLLGTKTRAAAEHIARRWELLGLLDEEAIRAAADTMDENSGELLELTMLALYKQALGIKETKKRVSMTRLFPGIPSSRELQGIAGNNSAVLGCRRRDSPRQETRHVA